MIIRDENINDLLRFAEGKKLVCYGAGKYLHYLSEVFAPFGFAERIDFVADTYAERIGSEIRLGETIKPLGTLDSFQKQNSGAFVLLITSGAFYEIFTHLNNHTNLKDITCYIGAFLTAFPPNYKLPEYDAKNSKPIIPKIIHYCWFSGEPIPVQYQQYMQSWRKFCPDYEIVEWNSKNYDMTKSNYLLEAYNQKKWTYAGDYARLDIVYQHGGIYIDLDVKLIKSFDRFLTNRGFCGLHSPGSIQIGSAFGAVSGHELIRKWLDYYDSIHFLNADGTVNTTTSTVHQTNVARKYGFLNINSIQEILDMTIYPSDVFSPKNPDYFFTRITENTHSIHNYASTWINDDEKSEKSISIKRAQELLAFAYKDGASLHGL